MNHGVGTGFTGHEVAAQEGEACLRIQLFETGYQLRGMNVAGGFAYRDKIMHIQDIAGVTVINTVPKHGTRLQS